MQKLCAVTSLVFLAACATPQKQPVQTTPTPDPTIVLIAADAARNDGKFADASAIYQRLIWDHPDLRAAQYGLAESLLATAESERARPLFDGLIADEEFHARALQGVGLTQLVLNEREKATKTLHDATEADPTLWRSWNALGLIADGLGDFKTAQDDYTRALALNPNSAVILNNIGYSKLMAKQAEEAETYLRRALSLAPGSETIQNNLRLAIAGKGDYAEAVRFTPHEKLPGVLNNVGYVAMGRGDYTVAEGYFVRAMEASKSFDRAAARNLDELKSLTGKDQTQ
jgi:Flp pilus assembly protein TadD